MSFPPHIMSHVNYVSDVWDGCARVHLKQLCSLHKRAIQLLMPTSAADYKQKCRALKFLPLDNQLLLNKCVLCVLMQKIIHGKASQYLKDLMIPSKRFPVHGNKQILPTTRIAIFKTSLSFSGCLAWNSLPLRHRYEEHLNTFTRKVSKAFINSLRCKVRRMYLFIVLLLLCGYTKLTFVSSISMQCCILFFSSMLSFV